MDMQAAGDDTRFRPSDQLTAEELEARVRSCHSLNLTAREVKPLLRQLFEPALHAFLGQTTLAREILSFGLRLVGAHPFAARFAALATELGIPC